MVANYRCILVGMVKSHRMVANYRCILVGMVKSHRMVDNYRCILVGMVKSHRMVANYRCILVGMVKSHRMVVVKIDGLVSVLLKVNSIYIYFFNRKLFFPCIYYGVCEYTLY